MNIFINLLARLILISEPFLDLKDRYYYLVTLVSSIAPIVFILEQFEWWVKDNKQFGIFMCTALFINMGIGIWFHIKNKTFTFGDFFKKNAEMIVFVCVMYVLLEMLRYTAGDNIVGEVFRVFIQVSTLLYPTSKVAKNIFIMSNGKIPSRYIMEKLYNFEKNGDLAEFFNNKK